MIDIYVIQSIIGTVVGCMLGYWMAYGINALYKTIKGERICRRT